MLDTGHRGDKLKGMEEVLPPQTESGAGFEPTQLRQFTVFLDNRVGRLQMLVRALEDVGRIVTLAIEESADSALVRFICAEPDATRSDAGGRLLVRRDRRLGGGAARRDGPAPHHHLRRPAGGGDQHPLHLPATRAPKRPAVALYVEDPTFAARLLIRKGYDLLGESDFKNPPV